MGATATLALAATAVTIPNAASSGESLAEVFRPQLITVDTPDRAAKTRLTKLGLDLTEHTGRDYVEVVLHSPADVALLERAGFTWDVRIEDMYERLAQVNAATDAYAARTVRSALPSGRDTYRNLEDYEADMASLQAKYPKLVKGFEMARPSLDGRTIRGVEIGSDVTKPASGRPTFLLMGVHHAREWPSGELAMEFAIDLAKNYGKDARITRLLDRARVVVVPVINPDGFVFSRRDGEIVDFRFLNDTGLDPLGGQTSILTTPLRTYTRKNCRLVDGVDNPDGSCEANLMTPGGFGLGVDLNRNYGGLWGGPGAAATLPSPDGDRVAGLVDPTYRGAAPFSEPETQNVRDLVQSRQVTMMISNHTFSNLVLRPNGVNPETIGPDGFPVGNAPDEAALKRLGAKMTAENGYQNIHGWELYDTTGTTEDYTYNATAGFGYTFEIGANEFHPPYPQVVAEYVGTDGRGGNREAYLIALEHAVDTAFHGTLVGQAKPGTVLRLAKTFDTPTWDPENPLPDSINTTMTVGRNGKVEWVVNPSTRPVLQERVVEKAAEEPVSETVITGTPSPVPMSATDHEITLDSTQDVWRIDLEWGTPDDLDLEVYRKKADGSLELVGSSGNTPATAERVDVFDPAAGDYVLRVINYASIAPEYTLTSGLYETRRTTTGGGKEFYTLTCERGGKVLDTQKVFIDRGQVKRLDLRGCRR